MIGMLFVLCNEFQVVIEELSTRLSGRYEIICEITRIATNGRVA